MALVPIVTNITPHVAAWTASGIINAIRDHINATSATSHLTIDAYTLNEGLTVGFKAAGEPQQINFRNAGGTNIAPSMEPEGTIADPGDSTPTAPTGTGAEWSGEPSSSNGATPYYWNVVDVYSTETVGAGSRVWVIEMPDAFTVFITDTTNVTQCNGFHGGRIYAPFNSADAAASGQDGLGFASGKMPASGSSSTDDWFSSGYSPNLARWGLGEWGNTDFAHASSAGYVAAAAAVTYRPLPPMIVSIANINKEFAGAGYVGVTKYIRQAENAETPLNVIPDAASNQGWIYVNERFATSNTLHIWDKTVTP